MTNAQNFKYSFIVISLLGFICCLDRSDYNVALGIFGFLLWNEMNFPQKHRVLWTLFISLFGDLLWIIVVSIIEWEQEPIVNRNLRNLTQIISVINMMYKAILIIYAVCSYEQCSDMFKYSSFTQKVLYL